VTDNEIPKIHSANEQAPGQPATPSPALTRRNVLYGSAAAAVGAALLRGGGARPRLRPAGLRHSLAHALVAQPLQGTSGSFSLGQIGPAVPNTSFVTLTLSGVYQGSLLVATLMSTDASADGSFASPLNYPSQTLPAGWQLAKAVAGPYDASTGLNTGRTEIWYYAGTPDSPGASGGTTGTNGTPSVAFYTSSGTNCRGVITEFRVPSPDMMAVLDAGGQASGDSGGSFSLVAGSGNVGNALGIAVAADFFSSAISGTWTKPAAAWTNLRILGGTVTDPWACWYNLSLTAGVPGTTGVPVVDPGFTLASGYSLTSEEGWALAFAAFRLVAFQALYLDGGEMNNIAAVDPTGQQVILGGDVEGMWRSADYGNNWQATQDGIVWSAAWRCTAALAWSQNPNNPNEVYACVGKDAALNDGGFLASLDGGVTWSMRAPAGSTPGFTTTYPFLNFQANDAKALLPSGIENDQDRSVGHLIAQATVSGTYYVYAATWNSGVAISTNDGTSWSQSTGFPDGIPYLRALAVDPDSSTGGLYAGAWMYPTSGTATTGGLYHTADSTVAAPVWTPVTLPTGVSSSSGGLPSVSDLKVLGSNLYVAFTGPGSWAGIYLYNPGLSNGPWFTLLANGTSTNYGLWTSLDGYVVSETEHVIIAACGSGSKKATGAMNFTNVVQIEVNPTTGTAGTPTDLTGSAAAIILSPVPPNGQPWWHVDASWPNWLGGSAFGNAHVVVNPQNPSQIFVTGQSGCYVTSDGGTQWTIAVNGSASCSCLGLAADPNVSEHFVICGDDYNFIDVSGDNTGFSAKTTTEVLPTPASDTDGDLLESHGAVFDPRSYIEVSGTKYYSVVYVAVSTKYGQPDPEQSNADICWTYSASTSPGTASTTFYGTGFNTQLDTQLGSGASASTATVGLAVAISGSSYYLVATTLGNGIWQAKIPADPTDTAKWTWKQVNTTVGSKGTAVQPIPIITNAAGTNLYCYDRVNSSGGVPTGIWRCTNVGSTSSSSPVLWEPIWNLSVASTEPELPAQTVNDLRSGWLAVNPLPMGDGDELWVSTSQTIWKLPNASSGAVGSGITPVDMAGSNYFVNGAGGMAFTASSATLYAISLDGISSVGPYTQTPTQLLSLANGGSDWSQNADPCNSVSSYVAWPGPLVLTAPSDGQQTLLIGQQPNFCTYGTVST
jgi:hypothetical protein